MRAVSASIPPTTPSILPAIALRKAGALLAACNLTLIDRYRNGKMAVAINVEHSSGAYPSQFKLLALAMPYWPHATRALEPDGVRRIVPDFDTDTDHNLMFIGANYPVKCVEEVISSSIWLECIKEWMQIFRDAFIPVGRQDFAEVFSVFREGEIGVASRRTKADICGIDRLIECVPEVVQSVGGDGPKSRRQALLKLESYDLLSSLSVQLFEWHATAVFDKRVASSCKVLNVFPSPNEE